MSSHDDQTVVSVKNVSKDFQLPHERKQSVKSIFTGIFRDRSGDIETQKALEGISFEIKKGEFFGIVGRNGSGKSTLLKILAGIYQPTTGTVDRRGKLVPFIELGVGFNPELTGRENVYLNGAMLGFSNKEIDKMYQDIVDFAELNRFMDQRLKNYSSGMQVRLAFSMATRAKADILLVDEVLAVGDADFQRKCFKFFKQLKEQKKTVVFVSHDMNAVREYCDKGLLIEKSRIIRSGDIDTVASAYTKLFMEDKLLTKDDTEKRLSKKRWGTKAVEFTSLCILPQKITGDTELVTIRCKYHSNRELKNVVFGFSIKNAAGTIMCGTNSKILEKSINTKKNESNTIAWSIPNVFNDGDYKVDVAIIDGNDETIQFDWWEDATAFAVRRVRHTSYAIEPKIELDMGRN